MLAFYYKVIVKDSQGNPISGIAVYMNSPDEEGAWDDRESQFTTDDEGHAWGCWNLNDNPQNVTASAGGEGTVYNYNYVEVSPTPNFDSQYWTPLELTSLTFTATSGTITYDGTRKAIGTVSYNGGNGYAYYLVKTSSDVPNASSTEGTGWVQVNTGGTVYATSSAPSNAGTYYVFLKATAYGNYAAVNPKSGGNKAISKAAGSTGVATGAMTITYSTTTGTRTVSGNTNTVSVSSSNTSVATVAISGSTITVTRKGYGSATITCSVAEATNYNATTSTFTVNCNKAAGSVGTASNPVAQTYKASGTYFFQLAMTGNTGIVTYPTSITVKRGSTTITGWTCTSAGVVTVPARTNAASYTVTGNVTCAEGTNYYAVTTGQSRTWTVTISQKGPTLTFAAVSGTLTYSGNTQDIGTVNYDGDGTAYYIVSTSSTSPAATATGWTAVTNGTTIKSSAANAGTYYVHLRSTAGTNYSAVNPKNAGNKAIGRANATLTVTAVGAIYYNGSTQVLGTVNYDGDGTAYYIVSTSTTTPAASASGWTAITNGTTVSSTAATAQNYYIYLRATQGTNYNVVNPKRAATKAISKATPGITKANVTKTYDGNTYFVTANAPAKCTTPNTLTQPAGTIYYGTSSGATTYSISVPNAGGSSATNLTGSNNNMGQKDVGSKTVYVFFRPTDTTNYSDSNSVSATVTITQANGNVGTASNPAAQNYKDGNTTNYSFQLAMSGNTGTVTYPTSITVKKGSTTISGWSCTSAGVVTVPYAQDSGSYTVTGNVTCAASSDGNYKAVTSGQSRTWTITINQASNASVTPTINSSTLTYSASSTNRLISSTTAHGTSSYQLGYKLGSAATADSQITWGTANTTTLDLPAGANAGTYYLYKKWTADSNHSNNQTYVAIGSTYTKAVGKATGYLTATTTNRTYTGSEQVIATISTYSGAYFFGLGSSTTVAPTSWGSQNQSLKATTVGTYYVWAKCNTSTNYLAVDAKYIDTVTISKRTGAAPTFSPSNLSVTLVPTAANTSPAVNCGAFTAASAGHGGTITGYAIQSVKNGSTTVSGWTLNSSTRVITVPASTVGGIGYTVVLRATEGETATDTSSYKDATITVTVKKKAIPLTITPTSKTIYSITSNGTGNPADYTYNTFTITPSGNISTVSYSSSATGKAAVTSGGVVSYVSAGSATITVTDPGNDYWGSVSKTCAVTTTLDTVSSYTDYQNPTGLTIGSSVVPAGGGTSTITWSGTCKQNAKAVYASGYTYTSYTNLTISSPTKSVSGNTAVSSKGTTISNQTTAITTVTGTYSANGKSSTTTCSVLQAGNYVTAVQATSSNSDNLTAPHFSYANIRPGATSASPTLSGGAVYTFSSGSTLFNSSGSPSFGGTASYSRSYTLAESKNGFTAVNATSGVLTATSMGTTVTSARTSGTVTGVLTVTYTHASSYSAGGTVTSSTKSDTATCTQTANALTGLSMSVGTNTIAYNSTTSVTVTATYTSGASKNVSNLSATTYNDTSDPDIVQITKS